MEENMTSHICQTQHEFNKCAHKFNISVEGFNGEVTLDYKPTDKMFDSRALFAYMSSLFEEYFDQGLDIPNTIASIFQKLNVELVPQTILFRVSVNVSPGYTTLYTHKYRKPRGSNSEE